MASEVSVFKCSSYDKNSIKKIIAEYFRNRDFKGRKILIKPNMLQAFPPDQNVTTHPVMVEAAAEVFMEKGGHCSIGDSPSGWGLENARKAALKTGMLDVARRLNIEFDYFDGQNTREIKINKGKVIRSIRLAESIFSYDIIVSIPKLKTHYLTVFTMGIKNMLGIVPGLRKKEFHRRGKHPEDFIKIVCDIYSVRPPDYTILDAVEAMDRIGPVRGRTINLNRIFISDNAVSLDAAAVMMCGVYPHKISLIREASERGLGSIDDIRIVRNYSDGDKEFDNFETGRIFLPEALLPAWLVRRLSSGIYHFPCADTRLCSGCGNCVEVCPYDAIEIVDSLPVIDKTKCVKCFCCAERCIQKAIPVKRQWIIEVFLKIMKRLKALRSSR